MKSISVIAFVALAMLLAGYFSAYCYRAPREVQKDCDVRVYKTQWEAEWFLPAARIESFLRGKKVEIGHSVPSPDRPAFF